MGISTDLADSQSVRSAFGKIKQQYAGSALAAAVFNPGGGFVRKPFLELTEDEFTMGYESQGLVAFSRLRTGNDANVLQKGRLLLCPRRSPPPPQG